MVQDSSLSNVKAFSDKHISAGFGNKYVNMEVLQKYLDTITLRKCSIHMLSQIHSNHPVIISSGSQDASHIRADAMVTNIKDQALVIYTADCFPILFYDPQNGVIAAAHSGRKGTKHNIAAETIKCMQTMGASPGNIIAAVGPGISPQHYQVDEHTWQLFRDNTLSPQKFPCIDIRAAIDLQLKNGGICSDNIFHENICTWSNSDYYSYRRDKTSLRLLNWIMLR